MKGGGWDVCMTSGSSGRYPTMALKAESPHPTIRNPI